SRPSRRSACAGMPGTRPGGPPDRVALGARPALRPPFPLLAWLRATVRAARRARRQWAEGVGRAGRVDRAARPRVSRPYPGAGAAPPVPSAASRCHGSPLPFPSARAEDPLRYKVVGTASRRGSISLAVPTWIPLRVAFGTHGQVGPEREREIPRQA